MKMKKNYDGLYAHKISVNNGSFIYTSGNCQAMIQLRLENGVCVSPELQQQVEYVGDTGDE